MSDPHYVEEQDAETEAWVSQLFTPLAEARQTSWHARYEQPPEVLYHYAAATGLKGIVEEQRFFASNAAFLNDASELKYIDQVIATVLESLRPDAEGEAAEEFIKPWSRGTLGLLADFDVYVACFCTDGDLLSQWRGYPPAGGGYAIGLGTTSLNSHEEDGIHLRRAVYDPDEQRELIEAVLRPVLDGLASRESESGRDAAVNAVPRCLQLSRNHFAEFAFCFKHPRFCEEDEWRLVAVQQSPTAVTSVTASVSVPFDCAAQTQDLCRMSSFELPDHAGIFDGRLPVKEVVVGPTGHPDLAERAVTILLAVNRYPWPHTSLRASEIPLRV